jgi:hypothetical protein
VAFGIALGMFGTLDKASSWGEGLQTWARGGSGAGSGPPGLSLLMKPTRGHLDRDGAISCVVRLAGDAYLDEQGHTVLSPGGTFVADEICQPTTSTTAPVESTATSAP